MTQDPRRSLHRVTPLRNDPAAAWLTRPQRFRVAMTGWFGWITFSFLMKVLFWTQVVMLANFFSIASFRMAGMFTGMATLALIWPARRMILRRKAAKIAALVRGGPPEAVAVDEFDQVEGLPDGATVSLVGWIKAREQLGQPVAGEPCIGLALACHQKFPGVLETLCDFDLVDEGERTIFVQVAGGRMLGASNVYLTDGNARMMLVASLDLPVGAVATGWDMFVLRDGDPVMIVGFKQTALDPTHASVRAAPARAVVGSLPPKPLLIFPIAAERRAQAPTLFNLS